MIRAYRLYTGPDGNSHVVRGSVSESKLVEAQTILFKETPAHSSTDRPFRRLESRGGVSSVPIPRGLPWAVAVWVAKFAGQPISIIDSMTMSAPRSE